ncbi:MAG: 2,3-bisphosphoglycerate-independent phosphoglycerate mutase [Clostridiales bacterium]|nr:2,3-bisphosphoglycerate-independent phosphoglycerate mutase [Clostridiales bacterium]
MLTLLILDGFGINNDSFGNAIAQANTPNLDRIFKNYPYTQIQASGLAVGLPKGQMGNSEVGHMNMGAGRVVYQDLTLIDKSIEDGDFFENPAFKNAIDNCKNNGSALHLMGLLSDGGVHSHITHLYALLQLAKNSGLTKVYVHAFLDGRDTPPQSAVDYIAQLQDKIAEIGVGEIATLCGRYNIMDRDNHWDRIQKGYDAICNGKGNFATDAIEAVKASYAAKRDDEFVEPIVITKDKKPVATLNPGDSIICFNFRKDRARQFSHAFVDEDFAGFERKYIPTTFVAFTNYDKELKNIEIAFNPPPILNNLGEYTTSLGYKNVRIAETEKYAHITFYFNAMVDKCYSGEDRILIPSEKVATFDLSPKMRAMEIKDKAIEAINSKKYDFVFINFANCDMVGHTGNISAAIQAVEAVDSATQEVVDAVKNVGGTTVITADHGNAEVMLDKTTKIPVTSHTTSPVPFCIVSDSSYVLRADGKLADVAPTILDLTDITKPAEMTGESLIIR